MNTTTPTARPFTLTDIAESQNVLKRTAQAWLSKAKTEHGDIGELVGKTRYFSLLERDLLASYAAPPRPVRVDPLQVEALPEFADRPAPAPAAMTIDVGNHRGQLALPQQPSAIDLGAYRGENAALTSFEPTDIDRFLAAADGFMQAVDADFAHQQAVTQQKEAAASRVKAKVDQVKAAQLLYQVRSETLALHNRGIDAELVEGLSTLGKPAAAAAAPSSPQ